MDRRVTTPQRCSRVWRNNAVFVSMRLMRTSTLFLLVLGPSALLASVACGSSSPHSGFDPVDPNMTGFGSSGTSGSSIGGTSGASGTSGGGNQAGCSDAAKLVYVVSEDDELFSFAPDKLAFAKIGDLNCPSDGASPNSMAVDRTGTAWVNYSDGALYKVSTTDASCTKTTYEPLQGGFQRFGMAFATNGATSMDETLYVVGIEGTDSGQGLAKIDLSTMTLTKIGDFSGDLQGQGAELTGTGDGRLFGFFTTQPDATLAEINVSDGSTTNPTDLNGVNTGSAWAFSFWGGDFWFYTSNGAPSIVTRKQSSTDGSLSTAKDDVGGFRIVGAGVSTCAPTTPPR
jgi:hypothetical protein